MGSTPVSGLQNRGNETGRNFDDPGIVSLRTGCLFDSRRVLVGFTTGAMLALALRQAWREGARIVTVSSLAHRADL